MNKEFKMQVPESMNQDKKNDIVPVIMVCFCGLVALGFFVAAIMLNQS